MVYHYLFFEEVITMSDPLYIKMRQYRIFPILFSAFYLYIMIEVFSWYTVLPNPSDGQGIFATGVMAAGAAWFKFYVESGKLTKPN
jgi:hypothetical protein